MVESTKRAPPETERLRLRPWTLDDADVFHRIWGNPQVIWWGHAVDREESVRVLARVLKRCTSMPAGLGWWALLEKDTGAVVGGVMLQPARYATDVEVGYHVAQEAWGRGYATEAARAIVRYGLDELGLPRIVAAIHPDNYASRRVVDKLGMRNVGDVLHDGQLHHLFVVAD